MNGQNEGVVMMTTDADGATKAIDNSEFYADEITEGVFFFAEPIETQDALIKELRYKLDVDGLKLSFWKQIA